MTRLSPNPCCIEKIRSHPSPRSVYLSRLVRSGVLQPAEEQQLEGEFTSRLEDAYRVIKQAEAKGSAAGVCVETSSAVDSEHYGPGSVSTEVSWERLKEIARSITTVPEGFQLLPKLRRRLDEQRSAVEEGRTIDWGTAELLSFGTLLREGTPVRLSGQDSMRGTFSQRHAVWFDTNNGQGFIPLNGVHPEQARLCVYNSSLTEGAVLGFEYGYSLEAPEMLILWEAQFGDFANGAQVIIDQFLVSSGAKWGRTSGLVMLLPHGYEGQGPEHSNGYLERYLMACAEHNIQVCNLTTPAQYFHVLRRQIKRPFRRPLIVMSPKSMLRHPRAVSPVADLVDGQFHEVLDDPAPPEQPTRMVLCSGKLFYDLLAGREKRSAQDAVLVRLEQLYPFPSQRLQQLMSHYRSVERLVWAQEEPENRGAYRFVRPLLEKLGDGRAPVVYAGRPASASPATGSLSVHRMEQEEVVEEALGG